MKKITTLMKKIIFLLLTVLSISCQMNTSTDQEPEKLWQTNVQEAIEIAKETGMEVVIIRPPLVYGPGVKGNFLNLLKLYPKEKGHPSRSLRSTL